jgi:hypothetical protein
VAYSLGDQNSIEWNIPPGQEIPTMTYTSSEKRSLFVDLRCINSDEPDKLEVHGRDDISGLYKVTLSSKCVCWGGCKGQKQSLYYDLM